MDAGASADTPWRLLVAIETPGAEIKKGREWGEKYMFFHDNLSTPANVFYIWR